MITIITTVKTRQARIPHPYKFKHKISIGNVDSLSGMDVGINTHKFDMHGNPIHRWHILAKPKAKKFGEVEEVTDLYTLNSVCRGDAGKGEDFMVFSETQGKILIDEKRSIVVGIVLPLGVRMQFAYQCYGDLEAGKLMYGFQGPIDVKTYPKADAPRTYKKVTAPPPKVILR